MPHAPRATSPGRALAPGACALAATLALCAAQVGGCGETAAARADAGSLDFTIGGTPFRAVSGTVQASAGALTFWLTNQPDACCAILATPQTPLVVLKLQAAPPTDGSTQVTVVSKASPGAGQAVGALTASLLGNLQATHAAASGTLAWTVGTNGYYTITALDVGFADTADRLALPAAATFSTCTTCTPP